MSTLSDLSYMRLLPEETTSVLGRLELLARAKKRGPMTGRHASPDKGFSVVFAEHRQYTPGDDIRDLDWRVYGKSDRYYIKQYIEETNLRATVVLDCSGSMKYRGEAAVTAAGRKVSKFEYARYLSAALSWVLVRQQDAVGLVTFDETIRTSIRAASKPSQVRTLLEEMDRCEPGGDTRLAPVLHEVAERIPQRGLVILVSDFFEDPERLIEAFHHFRYRQHELVLLHVMADEELTFPFRTSQEFKDLEPALARVRVDPRTIRAAYLEKVKQHIARLEQACGQMRADYVPVNTKLPWSGVLTDFLARRARKR